MFHLMDGKKPCVQYTDKKDKKIFLIFKEIQKGSNAKSYMRKGFLMYEQWWAAILKNVSFKAIQIHNF